MIRLLLLAIAVSFPAAACAQAALELEKASTERIEQALALDETDGRIDELTVILLESRSECVSAPPDVEAAFQRIRTRIEAELRLLPGTARRQETLVKEALAAIRSSNGTEETKKNHQLLMEATKKMAVVFHTLRPPEMLGSLKRMLEDYRETFRDRPQPANAHRFLGEIYILLMSTIQNVTIPEPSQLDLDDWEVLLALTQRSGLTFKMWDDPTEYDLNGPVRAAKIPDIPRAADQRPVKEEKITSPQTEPGAGHFPWIATLAAAAIAIGSWLWFRKKNSA